MQYIDCNYRHANISMQYIDCNEVCIFMYDSAIYIECIKPPPDHANIYMQYFDMQFCQNRVCNILTVTSWTVMCNFDYSENHKVFDVTVIEGKMAQNTFFIHSVIL